MIMIRAERYLGKIPGEKGEKKKQKKTKTLLKILADQKTSCKILSQLGKRPQLVTSERLSGKRF